MFSYWFNTLGCNIQTINAAAKARRIASKQIPLESENIRLVVSTPNKIHNNT